MRYACRRQIDIPSRDIGGIWVWLLAWRARVKRDTTHRPSTSGEKLCLLVDWLSPPRAKNNCHHSTGYPDVRTAQTFSKDQEPRPKAQDPRSKKIPQDPRPKTSRSKTPRSRIQDPSSMIQDPAFNTPSSKNSGPTKSGNKRKGTRT